MTYLTKYTILAKMTLIFPVCDAVASCYTKAMLLACPQ